ncbi:MAG TPA: M23 family metallopeptidase [Methylomirabilota bacterium]|nr:M23 family metallopeptidase [Methylomirabilota bacterium]
MRARMALLLAALLLVPSAAGAVTPGRPPGLSVRISPTAPRQGDMVFVLVTGAQGARDVEGSLDGRSLAFFPYGENWAALIGVDLDARPGKVPWRVGVIGGTGVASTRAGSVAIRARTFPVQHLTLPNEMVELDAESERRAAAEAARLRTLYDTRSPDRFWQGRFTRPVRAEGPGSGFGSRRVINGKPRSPHGGTDWSAERGTPVVAANRGRVALVGDFFFGGNLVALDHGLGLYTLYMHLDRVDVREGAVVERGEPLGTVGSTGRATGPHLHFQVQAGRSRVDPATLFALPVGD